MMAPVISLAVRVLSFQGFNDTNSDPPLDRKERLRILIPEIEVTYLISGKSLRNSCCNSSNNASVRAADEPSGNVTPAKNIPPSSVGIKPVGLVWNIQPVPINIHKRITNTSGAALIDLCTPFE